MPGWCSCWGGLNEAPHSATMKQPTYGTMEEDVEEGKVFARAAPHPQVEHYEMIPKDCQGAYKNAPVAGISAKIISLSLDTANNTFLADFNINIAWRGADKDSCPEVQFYNIIEEMENVRSPEVGAKKGANGWDWFYRVRCRGVFRQQYELHKFPFDVQNLKIDVRLKRECKMEPLAWGPHGEACSCDPRALMVDFELIDARVEHCYLPSYKFGKLAGYDPECGFVFEVRRKPGYWVINYGLMASVICSLMAATYAIPPEDIGERLGVATTLVLTMTATKYLMMDKLPPVAYATYLDYHILICSFVLALATVQLGAASFLGWGLVSAIEHKMLPVALAIWILYHIAFGIIIHLYTHGKPKIVKSITKSMTRQTF